MPTIFTAPQGTADEQIYESGIGDSRGYLAEGTYIARPTIGPNLPESAKTMLDPQEAYTESLKKSFLAQRKQLHVAPSKGALASLDDRHPISCLSHANRSYAEWTKLLKSTTPLPAQVRAMDDDTVYAILSIVQRVYLQRSKDIGTITGAWIWALLARLDDVGLMSNDQVYPLRELGKQAVLVQLSFNDPSVAQQLEAVGAETKAAPSNSDEIQLDDEDVVESNECCVRGEIKADSAEGEAERQKTLATIDMIITIVGEVFGQRDLLEFRQPWRVDEPAPLTQQTSS